MGLALVCLGDLVEEGLGADGRLTIDGGEPFSRGLVGLGGLDDGAVGSDGRSDDQGEREGVAWPGVNLGGALWAVDHDDRVVGAFGEAVDADLAQAATEGVDEAGAQVGAERSGKSGAVAEEAKGDLYGGLLADPDRQAPAALGLLEEATCWSRPKRVTRRTSLTGMSRKSRSVAVGMTASFARSGEGGVARF